MECHGCSAHNSVTNLVSDGPAGSRVTMKISGQAAGSHAATIRQRV